MGQSDEGTPDQVSSKDQERREIAEEIKFGEKASAEVERSHPWQAVWDATRQAWYFWNSETQETTWENPLEKSKGEKDIKDEKSNDTTESKVEATRLTDEEIAEKYGIDRDLAYLDPGLFATEIRQARLGNATYAASGAFDKRTGKFVPLSATGVKGAHDPSRLSHANQADRQMSAFFDIEQYEQERKRARDEKEQEEAEGISKKRAPTKKELQRYKERAKEKKAAKYAWLRE